MFGGSIEDFKAELGTGWVISQFVDKVVLKGNQVNGNQVFSQWLTQVKAKSKVETYEKARTGFDSKGILLRAAEGDAEAEEGHRLSIQRLSRRQRLKDWSITRRRPKRKGPAPSHRLRCHIQVDIIEDGKVVVSLTYRQGEVQEI